MADEVERETKRPKKENGDEEMDNAAPNDERDYDVRLDKEEEK